MREEGSEIGAGWGDPRDALRGDTPVPHPLSLIPHP
jgi:hypothetical protein